MSETSFARSDLRWAILGLISVSHVIGAAAQYGINTLAPFYQDELHLSRAQVGLFFSAFYLAMTASSFGAGWLADRLGVGRTTLTGHVFVGLCTAAAAAAPSFTWAFVSFFLAGLGYSFLNPSSTKGVMLWFPREERATAMGLKQTGVPAGGVVAALLAPPMVLWFGWRAALAALGIINLLCGFVFSRLWRDPPDEPQPARIQRTRAQALETLDIWSFLPASFGTAVFLIGQMSLITYLPLFLKESMGAPAYWASQALAITQAGAMAGRIGWGMASDRLFGGRRKIVLVIIGVLSAALMVALSVLPSVSSLALLVAIVFLAGLCLVGYQGVSYALIGELAGKTRTGAAMGIMITINAAAATVGTPIFGYIVDATGSYTIAWQALAAAIGLGSAALVFFLTEPPR
ncbi:MAG TPA: MFS transporter [Candidatus Eisenbacteria bacterium]|nr:MFS transporter [Candidatus Eisenbacteria bacterium]